VLIRKTTIMFIPNLRFSPQHSVINPKIYTYTTRRRLHKESQPRTAERRGESESFPFLQIQQKDFNPQENEKRERSISAFPPPDL
jgi:hypothetical protein